ncbi:MAG TPA: chloride channel protein [Tepidisphaeraceae bacterium]|jgi:CIC family chloride channel protein
MLSNLKLAPTRVRVLSTRALSRLGFREDSFLIVLAVVIGVVTAAAAVTFHQIINLIRDELYQRIGAAKLYGPELILLIVWPALGGLAVGLISRYVFRAREGHGIVDVMESVIRSSGFIKPLVAIEKIITSGITIGTGGSAGAEGPIVQIGAAIASGTGQTFRISRQQMSILIACGAAAGISAIFNAPMGGLLFALEVILQDFSIHNMTPVVVASVIANVATKAIFIHVFHERWDAIFYLEEAPVFKLDWLQVQNFIILGVICGIVGVCATRLMYLTEREFHRLRLPAPARPAIGGALLGCIGVAYVVLFGHLQHQLKPVPFEVYPAPAFYGDGYGFIQRLVAPGPNHSSFYTNPGHTIHYLFLFLAFLTVAKLIGTCLTLGSGGSGGIIAPSLFLGAVAGGGMGMAMRIVGLFDVTRVYPEAYAIVGMGAVLAAIVHAPLASILIVLELTYNPALVLPAMLAVVVGTGIARLIYPDSIYTAVLRLRGIRVGPSGDVALLHRMTVEQVTLDPVTAVSIETPVERLLQMTAQSGVSDFVVIDRAGKYSGMVVADDLRTVMLEREAIPLLVAGEVARIDLPAVHSTDDLAKAMETFALNEVARLPVCLATDTDRIIGLISRRALMQRYNAALSER